MNEHDRRLLAWMLRRPPWGERCDTCYCWQRLDAEWGECTHDCKPWQAVAGDTNAEDVCSLWEPRKELAS